MENKYKDFVIKPSYELPQGICAEGAILITGLKTLRDSTLYDGIDKEIRHAIANIANISKLNAVVDLDEEEQRKHILSRIEKEIETQGEEFKTLLSEHFQGVLPVDQ